MKVLLILICASSLFAAEPWRLDAGVYLQFPIPAGTTELADRYTPIIGGGGDFHFWFSDKFGIGIKSSSDYLTDMERNVDLIELTQLAQVNYRFSFSDKSFATFGLEGGGTIHLYRSRGEWKAIERSAPVAGAYVGLPVRKYNYFIIGPHAEVLMQFFPDEQDERASPELYVAVGVTVAFVLDFK